MPWCLKVLLAISNGTLTRARPAGVELGLAVVAQLEVSDSHPVPTPIRGGDWGRTREILSWLVSTCLELQLIPSLFQASFPSGFGAQEGQVSCCHASSSKRAVGAVGGEHPFLHLLSGRRSLYMGCTSSQGSRGRFWPVAKWGQCSTTWCSLTINSPGPSGSSCS